MTSTTQPKPFDCVASMREIRNRISAEIADMSYSELSQWLAEQVHDDPFFSRIPKPGQPGRPDQVARPQERAEGGAART